MWGSCTWTRPGCLGPQTSGTSTSPWWARRRSSRCGTQTSSAPSPTLTLSTMSRASVLSTSVITPSFIHVSSWSSHSSSGETKKSQEETDDVSKNVIFHSPGSRTVSTTSSQQITIYQECRRMWPTLMPARALCSIVRQWMVEKFVRSF